ncbi:hypothetical protein AVEN_18621-1 [Araneus ventricosus]|uniref:ISXO2-like transposase domain-containing protein n=1 Tax=Araneus ventricosus TaxID=182803 RepID=A0A4Y2VAT6_ARAVE|nr:hypothetical protein AVEN_18621-1 [Araneus ventricosus]
MAPNSGNIGSLSTYHQLQTAETKVVFQWCVDQGSIASGYKCPKCKRQMVLRPRRDISDGFNWVCRIPGQNAHHMKRSARAGSRLEQSNLPIPNILPYLLGKRVVGRWVFGGVERGTNNCFFAVVENRTSEVLLSVIEDHILPGTTVMSDCWSSYQCLSDEGFVHLTVNHSMYFVDPDTGAHTSSIEGTWSALKGICKA